ncbi:Quinoprotein amine dehydrogenase beta chain-like protein [Gracilaria domingensis]|nr:Quinoprotein amine dehydrogenase beta chain-like protein [Gracilaria domingensis]
MQIASHLSPRDRFALAQTSHAVFRTIWPSDVRHLLTARFPFETRIDLSIHPSLSPEASLRLVPSRSQQAHLALAVSQDGSLVALLPYDNRLRLVHVPSRQVLAEEPVTAHAPELVDVHSARRTPSRRNPQLVYAQSAALDVPPMLSFHSDMILLSTPYALSLLSLPTLKCVAATELRAVRQMLPQIVESPIVGAAGAVSPDGSLLAWVLFAALPATAYVSIWRRCEGRTPLKLLCVRAVATVRPQNWSTLAWARCVFSPNGHNVLLVANLAEHVARVMRVGNRFHRKKMCRYRLALLDVRHLYQTTEPSSFAILREVDELLELNTEQHAQQLSQALLRLLNGADVYADAHCDGIRHRERGMALNCVHTCPAEATYKALMFGEKSLHPWFVTKQPQYSLHFSAKGGRVIVSSLPQSNFVHTYIDDTQPVQTHTCRKGRLHAFKRMPWRSAFAAASAFSENGQWLVGGCLLDGDACCVCVRNVTVDEYFGV